MQQQLNEELRQLDLQRRALARRVQDQPGLAALLTETEQKVAATQQLLTRVELDIRQLERRE